MALVNLAKFATFAFLMATFAFLICTMASPFGSGAEMVIKEVVTNIDENCSKVGERTQIEEVDVAGQNGCAKLNQSCWPERRWTYMDVYLASSIPIGPGVGPYIGHVVVGEMGSKPIN